MGTRELIERIYGLRGLEKGLTLFVYGAILTALGAYLGSTLAHRLRPRDAR